MSEIKSQKAIELLNSNSVKQNTITNALMPGNALLGDRYTYVTKEDAKNAVIIAETEAEERHVKEIAKYNQSLDEAKQREQLSQNVIAEQRKQLQELRDILAETLILIKKMENDLRCSYNAMHGLTALSTEDECRNKTETALTRSIIINRQYANKLIIKLTKK